MLLENYMIKCSNVLLEGIQHQVPPDLHLALKTPMVV
jgi:hypothetical protein